MRIFSGIQPTGRKQLGNLLGAIRHWVPLQEEHEAMYCIVDLHALTVLPDPQEMRESTLRMAALFVAAGLDPDRCTLFVQSHVGDQHTELGWLLGCVASYGELSRQTQFKEKSSGKSSFSVGLFTYPVLQAADILLYGTNAVPIGEDQKQHLELSRDIAERFNARFGETFAVPEPLIPSVGARVMDLQDPTSKMSTTGGSEKGTLFLLDPPETLAKKIRSAVTDTGTDIRCAPDKPGVTNLIHILASVTDRDVEAVEAEFEGAQYGAFKVAVADAVVDYLRPMQDRYHELVGDTGELERMLAAGAERARELGAPTVQRVKQLMGCVPPVSC